MYGQWKQRLYAFLIRRIVGPYLAANSLRKLHESIEVSLQEGKFVFTDVDLNAEYLTLRLSKRGDARVGIISVTRARIRKLRINLSLEEPESRDYSSSVAWKAFQLGRTSSSVSEDGSPPGVFLVAQVELEGLSIEIEPDAKAALTAAPLVDVHAQSQSSSKESGSPSMISSYIDAALSSLRLSLQVNDLQIKFCNRSSVHRRWVNVQLASAYYHDIESRSACRVDQKAKTTTSLHKAIDFSGLTLMTGEDVVCSEESSESIIGKTEGTGQISLRVIEYPHDKSGQSIVAPSSTSQGINVQNDVEVLLSQKLNILIDDGSLDRIAAITADVAAEVEASQKLKPGGGKPQSVEERTDPSARDDEDMELVTGIMKQYTEARLLAARNEIRGGVLIPRSASEDDDDGSFMAFDAFFDANDHSFYHYNSVLEKSALGSVGGLDETEFVYTRVKLHLQDCGIKIEFPRQTHDHPLGDGYILLRMGDISSSASVSNQGSELSLDVSHLSIEDSIRVPGTIVGNEIGRILHFIQDDIEISNAVVSEAPCLSLRFLSQSARQQTRLDVSLEPVELIIRLSTLWNVNCLLDKVKGAGTRSIESRDDKDGVEELESAVRRGIFQLSVTSPSVSVQVPIIPISTEPPSTTGFNLLSSPFGRCGYALYGHPVTRYPSLDLAIRSASLSVLVENDSFKNPDAGAPSAVHRASFPLTVEASSSTIVLSVIYPHLDTKGVAVSMCRMDILSMTGAAPISLSYRRAVTTNEKEELGKIGFPVVPSVSSFKARQEDDDDEDEQGSRYFSSRGDSNSSALFESPVRAADPQTLMVEAAAKCHSLLSLEIPDMIGDLTYTEAVALQEMLSDALRTKSGGAKTVSVNVDESESQQTCTALAVKIDHASLAAHTRDGEGDNFDSKWYSYKLMLEGFRVHGVVTRSRVTNVRIMGHETNLLECCDLIGVLYENKEVVLQTSRDRCEGIRKRTLPNDLSDVRPLFFRSQLFTELSPESPSLLLDLISLQTTGSVEKNAGWKVHFTLYNITHRYSVDSRWQERLQRLLPSSKSRKDNTRNSRDTDLQTSKTSLVKLFVSLADCTVDYTSSLMFDTPGRIIARVGDCRLSSNIVLPSGPAQAYKVSLGDITIQLCNERFDHKPENSLLTRAATIFLPRDLLVNQPRSPVKALQAMHLVTMLTLDAADMTLSLVFCELGENLQASSEPKVTTSLSFGNLCLYGCNDSFSCFTSVIAELQLRMASHTREAVEILKAHHVKSVEKQDDLSSSERFYDSRSGDSLPAASNVQADANTLESTAPNEGDPRLDKDAFALDGYDWTTVDHEWSKHGGLSAGDEQSAKWYPTSDTGVESSSTASSELGIDAVRIFAGHVNAAEVTNERKPRHLNIISNHIQLQPVSDPLSHTDMDAAKYASTQSTPTVHSRIIIRDLNLRCRFFDGYDWPHARKRAPDQQEMSHHFIIEESLKSRQEMRERVQEHVDKNMNEKLSPAEVATKTQLLTDLLEKQDHESSGSTFQDAPLPEERGRILQKQEEYRRVARRMNRFFQVSLSGLKVRVDNFADSKDHRLASCLDMVILDLFLAETISSEKPVKLLGEWFNEVEHPRVSTDGMIMMKMVTWHAAKRVGDDGHLMNDESIARLQILPLRARLDQRALRFAQAFFSNNDDREETSKHQWLRTLELTEIPPPKFLWFKVTPCKMKVDYRPIRMDVDALRDGSYVELINLSPLSDMVIVLQGVVIDSLVGFGAVLREMLARWIEDICATQMYKFVANASPFRPFASVGGGAADMFVLPFEAYRDGGGVARAIRSGASSFAETVAYETLNTTAKIAGLTAQTLSSRGLVARPLAASSETNSPLPSRPRGTPRGVGDTAQHALESIARGIETANYKVVIVPYREYHRSGPSGAARSVMRGIPVAVMAPIGAASEAISYTLLGARNQIRPDIRKEEEASERGLHHDG